MILFTTKVDNSDDILYYKTIEDSKAFARYSKGLVYIGDKEYISDVENNVDENDILVLDERKKDDPNIKIFSSYQICDKRDREDILSIIELYEDVNPTEWDRSHDSMIAEWEIHNILHSLGIKLDRTTDVDLNNEDEKIYDDKLLKLIFRA